MVAEVLRRETVSLVARLRLWTPARWSAAAPDLAAPGLAPPAGSRGVDDLRPLPPVTRADVVFHLALAWTRQAGAPVALPRLDSDLALPDQLAVAGDDLARTDLSPRAEADAVAHLLLHRWHLLGEAVPAGLAAELTELTGPAGPAGPGGPAEPGPVDETGEPGGLALLRRARRVCADTLRDGPPPDRG